LPTCSYEENEPETQLISLLGQFFGLKNIFLVSLFILFTKFAFICNQK